jgi:hypothetical protein
MPLEVLCPGCNEVLQAPHSALGRKVKCPQCGKPFHLRVPDSAQKIPASPSDKEIDTGRLNRLHDATGRICPNCGTRLSFDDPECPACHALLGTVKAIAESVDENGQQEQKAKLFYQEFIRDGLEFCKSNQGLSLYLACFWMAFTALCLACLAAALWSVKPLERTVCVICGSVAILFPLGLAWNLNVAIVDATLRKKKKLRKYRFDVLAGIGVGIKLVAWFLDVAAPAHVLALVAVALSFFGMPRALPVAGGLEAAGFLFASLLFPIASTQMAVPAGTGGWRVRTMWRPLRRTIPAILRWCGCFYVTLALPLACLALGAFFYGKDVGQLIDSSRENSKIYVAKNAAADSPGDRSLPSEVREVAGKSEIDMPWRVLIVPAGLMLLAATAFGGSALFPMRINGLYAHCFLDRLDLETRPSKTSYVARAQRLDQIVVLGWLNWNKILIGLGTALGTGILIGGTTAAIAGQDFFAGAAVGLWLAGIVLAIGTSCWLLFEAAEGIDFSHAIRYAVLLVPLVVLGGAFIVMGQLTNATWIGRHGHGTGSWLWFVLATWLAATLGLFAGLVAGLANWAKLKYLTALLVGGYLGALVGAAVYAALPASG